MTDKQALAALLYEQQLAIAKMAIDIGDRMAKGKDVSELFTNLKAARQLVAFFLSEYGKDDASFDLLRKCINAINSLINNYKPEGLQILEEYEVTSSPPKMLNINFQVEGGGDNTPTNPADYITTLRLSRGALTEDYEYVNYGLVGVVFTLVISGGITLREGFDYELLPSGGFKLINGVAMADTDVLTLTSVKAFNSIPIDSSDNVTYVKADYVQPDYVE